MRRRYDFGPGCEKFQFIQCILTLLLDCLDPYIHVLVRCANGRCDHLASLSLVC